MTAKRTRPGRLPTISTATGERQLAVAAAPLATGGRFTPGDIVAMDNLSSHKVSGARQAIKNANAFLLYLPPYSPDINPIELAFSKLKALLRKAAPRSIEDLWAAIADLLDQFSPHEFQIFFRHAGYGWHQS